MKQLLSITALSICLAVGLQAKETVQAEVKSTLTQTKQQSGTVINLAGKQRMLTQKMSKEALFIAKGVDVDANIASLKKTAALFDKTLKGLALGDDGLNLPKTEDAEILAQLQKVTELWVPFKANIDKVVGGNSDKATLEAIAKENIPLLKNMNKAVQMYAKASGSKLDPQMAKTINLAGKQRMLTQKMTKELLLVANGIDAPANSENAKKTVALFEKTLNGLIKGDESLGLKGTQDAGILKQLEVVQKLLAEYKPIVEKVETSDEALKKALKLNIPLLKNMNKAVKMYEGSIK